MTINYAKHNHILQTLTFIYHDAKIADHLYLYSQQLLHHQHVNYGYQKFQV